jgi:hypothetical protein
MGIIIPHHFITKMGFLSSTSMANTKGKSSSSSSATVFEIEEESGQAATSSAPSSGR